MKLSRLTPAGCLLALAALAGCSSNMNTNNAAATPSSAASPTPAAQTLTETAAPQRIKDVMAQRGEQDAAAPVLKINEPAEGAVVNGSTVRVRLSLSGDLKGYQPHKNPDGTGNHIHVILDNQPYEAYYNLDQPFELRNVSAGRHTLRVFPSRPWHESYKNEGAFQLVSFEVRGGGDPAQPTTTNSGQRMADPANSNSANANANTAATPEGKDYPPGSTGSPVDKSRPLLTYSRPKGEYRGADADPIMIDFWLSGGKLQGDGGDLRVRYTVDGGAPKFIDKWAPIWLSGWTAGKHTVRLELIGKDGNPVANGDYNATSREITVVK